jgi:hypothetical protein
MKANALNQVTFKIAPHDFAHAKSITENVIYQVVFYNSKGTSAPLVPPSKRQEGQLPLLPPPPSSCVPEYSQNVTHFVSIEMSKYYSRKK